MSITVTGSFLYLRQDLGDHEVFRVYDILPDIIDTKPLQHRWTTRINGHLVAPVGTRLDAASAALSSQLIIKHFELLGKPYLVTSSGAIILMK